MIESLRLVVKPHLSPTDSTREHEDRFSFDFENGHLDISCFMGDQVCRCAISANSGLNKKPGILINFCFLVHFITKLNSNSKVCIDLLSPQKLKPPLVTLSQLELDTSDLILVFPLET